MKAETSKVSESTYTSIFLDSMTNPLEIFSVVHIRRESEKQNPKPKLSPKTQNPKPRTQRGLGYGGSFSDMHQDSCSEVKLELLSAPTSPRRSYTRPSSRAMSVSSSLIVESGSLKGGRQASPLPASPAPKWLQDTLKGDQAHNDERQSSFLLSGGQAGDSCESSKEDAAATTAKILERLRKRLKQAINPLSMAGVTVWVVFTSALIVSLAFTPSDGSYINLIIMCGGLLVNFIGVLWLFLAYKRASGPSISFAADEIEAGFGNYGRKLEISRKDAVLSRYALFKQQMREKEGSDARHNQLSTLNHAIRSHVHAMGGLVALLGSANDPEERNEWLTTLADEYTQLETVVNQGILDEMIAPSTGARGYSHIIDSPSDMKLSVVDVREFVEEILEIVSTKRSVDAYKMIQGRTKVTVGDSVEFVYHIDADVPDHCVLEADRLRFSINCCFLARLCSHFACLTPTETKDRPPPTPPSRPAPTGRFW